MVSKIPSLLLSILVVLHFQSFVLSDETADKKTITASQPESKILRVAMVQPVPYEQTVKNLELGTKYCRMAAEQGADIVVFPEMFSLGYHLETDFSNLSEVARWKAMAQPVDGPFVQHFRDLAQELDLAILITYLERRDETFRNSATLFDRNGERVLTYSKVHLCSFFKMEGALEPGDDFYVAQLDTRSGPVNVGTMICYDREFPESARVLMLRGAEVILTPNACGLDPLRINQFQIRAWENSLAVAMANYCTKRGNGRSCAFGADGKQLLMAGDKEGLYIAEIDLHKLRETRKKTYWGNAWRKPAKYQDIISTKVQAPFHRTDAYGRPNHH